MSFWTILGEYAIFNTIWRWFTGDSKKPGEKSAIDSDQRLYEAYEEGYAAAVDDIAIDGDLSRDDLDADLDDLDSLDDLDNDQIIYDDYQDDFDLDDSDFDDDW